MSSVTAWVTVVFIYAVGAALGIVILWQLAKCSRILWRQERINFNKLCQDFVFRSTEAESPRLRLLIDSRRRKRLLFVAKCIPFCTCFFVYDYIREHITADFDNDFLVLSRPGILGIGCGTLFGLAAHLKPEWLGPRIFDVILVILDAGVMWTLWTVDARLIVIYRGSVCAYRVAVAVVTGNLWLTVVMNIAESALCSFRFSAFTPEPDSVLAAESSTSSMYLIYSELFVGAFAVLVAVMTKQGMTSEAEAILHSKLSRQSEISVQALLSGLCDCVVRLSSDLRVACQSQKLAALLLREAAPRYFDGDDFMKLISQADQQRAQAFLQDTDRSGEQCARLLNVSMDGSYGHRISVHLFHASFLTLDDEIGHILGICEAGYQELQQRTDRSDGFVRNQDVFSTGAGLDLARAPSSSRVVNQEEVSSVCSSVDLEIDDVSAWINVQDYSIIRVTPGFTQISGPCPEGDHIIHWFARSDSFNRAVQDFFQYVDTCAKSSVRKRIGTHRLRPPSAKKAGVQYFADCTLESCETSSEDYDVLRIKFSNVTLVHRSKADPTTHGKFHVQL